MDVFTKGWQTRLALLCILATCSFSASAVPEEITPLIDIDYTPALDSDEGGFWYKVAKLEDATKRSPYLVRDEKLNEYVSQLVCKLAAGYCSNIRVYIINNPYFNASMYPNGMMHVWTGLLLRVENEEQLVSVLAHEIAHYLRTHQIVQWRKLRSGLAFTRVLDTFVTFGFASLAYMGDNAAFSREQETEADKYGVQLMVAQGYSSGASHQLWEYIHREREQDKSKGETGGFFASHPDVTNRIDYLKDLSEAYGNTNAREIKDLLKEKISPHYMEFMSGFVELREYEQLSALIERHREIGYPDGAVTYFEGELHRLRDEDGDRELAIKAYERSISSGYDALPADIYRNIGYLHLKNKNNAKALAAFQKYLSLDTNAPDQEMILFYTDSLKGM